ncbi:rod shape-determining protein RodA [Campylobacter fetus]|uniref:Rod shape-determining protein RodA n=3 Tax=Campylobacter fetus TaxID=196 RepID=A0A5L4L2C0_CAMFE|nr:MULTISPECIES: FtsW/RodA/SpoVE family cell cycle protein [Campylobacter]OCS22777.1 rod shape-determining protein RodA [Campylobacter fetus subsp. venerealis cfvi97/532]OCS25450.1 rod shape-determining protein RodA [Campylobacter fetus subsp. venerealis cfvB10]OCS29771.1 rod shape-determining protein RodA [Campylobacter fetus subsp. venerealis LMG 6570 = CCUG 33900]OCS40410.1 rod shape-determining protein RodA [Campylobacter fetus subsp. venerealis cfvi02/298]ABK83418.1 cell cycle protein [Ca
MIRLDKRILTHFDFVQPILVLPIIILSYTLISEANDMLSSKQIVYFSIGFLAFTFFFLMPIRKIEWLIPTVYWINIILLFSVDIFGVSKLGAQRWLEIPFVHFTLQPSEIMKPSFILMLAYLIKRDPPGINGYNLKQFLKISIYILLPFGLILKEPDLGTAMMLIITGYGILFIIGVNKKIWLTLAICIGVAAPVIYESLHDYQKKRIVDFLSKEPSYQVRQSIIAIGNGGITGKSAEEATQTRFKFLPIATSDFIFAYTIERHGFIGGMVLILLYGFLIAHLLSLNYKLKGNYFIKAVTSGISILIFIYVSVNIFMTIGFAPVVGIPLPFYSYGGSSFVTFMCLFGILQNLLTFRFDPTYRFIKIKF